MLPEKPGTPCEPGKEERAPQPERSVRLACWKSFFSDYSRAARSPDEIARIIRRLYEDKG
jgi:hypothetical protein